MNPVIIYLITFILFILHELEEIRYFKQWFEKNGNYLIERFPRLGKRMIRQFEHISTKGFAFIALEETIILLLLLSYAFFEKRPEIGMGVIFMLCFHWLLTVIQSFIICRIIPGTYTSLAGVCLGIQTFWMSANSDSDLNYLGWGIIIFICAMANLIIMHAWVAKYRKSKSDRSLK